MGHCPPNSRDAEYSGLAMCEAVEARRELPIHVPSRESAARTQLAAFIDFARARSGRAFDGHRSLQAWSTAHWREFWQLFTEWCRDPLGIEGDLQPVCVGDECEHAVFFPQLRLNYADALLNTFVADADAPAIAAYHADGTVSRFTRGALREEVARAAAALRAWGLKPGDRVAAVLRNDDRAVIAALAVAAVGASLATAAPDMGVDALRDRFVPIAPRLLIAHGAAREHDAGIPLPLKLAQLQRELSSLEKVLLLDSESSWDEFVASADVEPFDWPRFAFNQPLFIMFTSGTTGPPKCIVHGAGGTLVEHAKEHRLHIDLHSGERLFFQTSCSWMMWNWQLSALASGAQIVTYDGPISSVDKLWQIVAAERVTVFGTSPPYLRLSQDAALVPRERFDLSSLRAICSTGSVLHDWQFDWIDTNVKHVPVWSISGGTDIIGCFVLGSPLLPVHAGESSCASLGMDVHVRGGQLVCGNPFPSRPLAFFGDADGSRFHAAYFAQNPGLWSHGDFAQETPHGGIRILGRCDGVLNVNGIKVSPGDISRVLLAQPGVSDVLVVEQTFEAQSRVLALLKLAEGRSLDSAFVAQLRRELAERLSTAHVPDLFLAVPDLPVTHSGKLSESAARRAVSGRPVENEAALRNPQCLQAIRDHPMLRVGIDMSHGVSLRERLAAAWADLFCLPQPPGGDAHFFELGGNSLMAARLLARTREITGRELPLSTMLHAPTLDQFIDIIEREKPATGEQCVLARAGVGRPVFLVHGLSGTVMECWPLISLLRSPRPVYGFQARGLDDHLAPREEVEAIALAYVDHLRRVQPQGPYSLWGFSFGGVVALEIARVLAREGDSIEHVGLIDTYVRQDLGRWANAWDTAHRALRRVRHMPLADLGTYVAQRFARRPEQAVPLAAMTTMQRDVHEAMKAALERYRPSRFEGGPLVYLRAAVPLGGYCDPLPVWKRIAAAKLKVMPIPGAHLDLVRATSAHAARAIDDVLQAVIRTDWSRNI
jgi:acetoacetyl-CoA synthetase